MVRFRCLPVAPGAPGRPRPGPPEGRVGGVGVGPPRRKFLAAHNQDEQRLALFIDFENIAIGVRDAHYRKFDINLVLERLLEKGKILVKKAYADWSRYSDYKRSFHEAAIELIEIPQKSVGGKNSADIRLVVDAMDMSFQKEHINTFVVASGDSRLLAAGLQAQGEQQVRHRPGGQELDLRPADRQLRRVHLLRGPRARPAAAAARDRATSTEKLQEAFALLVDSILALQRENKEVLWGSMVKETMKRKKPSFNETYYGFRTFSHLLEDAQRRGIVRAAARPEVGQLHRRGPGRRGVGRRDGAGRPATRVRPPRRPSRPRRPRRRGRAPRRRTGRPRRPRPRERRARAAAPAQPRRGRGAAPGAASPRPTAAIPRTALGRRRGPGPRRPGRRARTSVGADGRRRTRPATRRRASSPSRRAPRRRPRRTPEPAAPARRAAARSRSARFSLFSWMRRAADASSAALGRRRQARGVGPGQAASVGLPGHAARRGARATCCDEASAG